MPKQFLDITGRGPMVVETCDRLASLARDDELILVIAGDHREETARLFVGRNLHIIAEPVGRNTAACIGLGALVADRQGASGPLAFLPADHFIADRSAFLESLTRAASLAASGAIVTLGIMPTRPETGYGYIRRGEERVEAGSEHAYRVSAFVEKPDLEKAKQYLARGDYYWNAGIFVATPRTILSEMKDHLPDLYTGLMRLKGAVGTADFEREIADTYPRLESVSFDYGIMERTERPILVLPCECGWSDVGSWASLYELRKGDHDQDGNLAEGEPLLLDCKETYVSSRGGRLVACIGLKNCLVVDTPDALLVTEMSRSQDIRRIIEELKKRKKEELL
jgi:mannose-1-phosphate guanylyltransferase